MQLEDSHEANIVNGEAIVRDVIVIGGSAGSYLVIKSILAELPEDLPAIVGIVIHRGVSWSDWSESLGRASKLRVSEGRHGELLEPGSVHIAPSDAHMRFMHGRVSLDHEPKEHFTRPAVNPLFVSAAGTYGARVVGLVLSGSGSDGAMGLRRVWQNGGLCLVQRPSEAEHASMPQCSIEYDHVDAELSVHEIARKLALLVRGGQFHSGPFESEAPSGSSLTTLPISG